MHRDDQRLLVPRTCSCCGAFRGRPGASGSCGGEAARTAVRATALRGQGCRGGGCRCTAWLRRCDDGCSSWCVPGPGHAVGGSGADQARTRCMGAPSGHSPAPLPAARARSPLPVAASRAAAALLAAATATAAPFLLGGGGRALPASMMGAQASAAVMVCPGRTRPPRQRFTAPGAHLGGDLLPLGDRDCSRGSSTGLLSSRPAGERSRAGDPPSCTARIAAHAPPREQQYAPGRSHGPAPGQGGSISAGACLCSRCLPAHVVAAVFLCPVPRTAAHADAAADRRLACLAQPHQARQSAETTEMILGDLIGRPASTAPLLHATALVSACPAILGVLVPGDGSCWLLSRVDRLLAHATRSRPA
jgi:hypothetical protein